MSLDMALHPGVMMSGWDADAADLVLTEAAALGYRRVVVPLRRFETLDPAAVRAVFERHGLSPITAGNQTPEADVSSDDDAVRQAGEQRLRAMIAFTHEIGGDQISGVLYGVLAHADGPVTADRFTRTARILGRIADDAAAIGVRVVCEVVNRYETAMMNTSARAVEFIDASGSDALGLHLDTFHMNIEERDPVAAVATALPHLAYVEIGQNDRGALQGGPLDLGVFLDGVVALGYRGRFGVEAFSASVLSPDIARALAIWRDTFGSQNSIASDAIALVAAASASS